MTDAERRDQDATRLLASQLDALARFRHVVEAQRAVLRMGDAGLLEVFSREADGIANDISVRENQLLAIRAAAQRDPAPGSPPRLAQLASRVADERAGALADVASLAQEMEREASGIARSIQDRCEQLDRLVRGYGKTPVAARPALLDRTA